MANPLGAIGGIGSILGSATSLAGGIFGMIQAGKIKGQKQALLNQRRAIFNNIEMPLIGKQNLEKMSDFNVQTADAGVDVKSLGAGMNRAEQSTRLQNFLNLTYATKQNEFQAEQNNINNEYSSSMFQGAAGIVSGAGGIASGIAQFK